MRRLQHLKSDGITYDGSSVCDASTSTSKRAEGGLDIDNDIAAAGAPVIVGCVSVCNRNSS